MRRARRALAIGLSALATAFILTAAPGALAAPAGAPPSAVSAPSSPSSAPAYSGPCRDNLAALPIGKSDPNPYLDAAACLRRSDSSAAGYRMPFEISLQEKAPSPADALLRSKIPQDKGWVEAWLERMRVKRDGPRSLDMAWLAEAFLVAGRAPSGVPDMDVWREIGAVYLSLPDPYHASLALLRQAELDTLQAGYVQYQIENALRTPGIDTPVPALLDSLTAVYRHRVPRTAEILETLCWGERAYASAFKNFQALQALKDPGPSAALDRVNRFQSLGYFDYAAAILDKLDWKHQPQPWQGLARSAALQIRFQLQDWPGLLAEAGGDVTAKLPSGAYSPEEAFFVATALLKLGRARDAFDLLQAREAKATPPWGFRGRLLKAQAQMALGKPQDAARTLDALKQDPKRQEGTGPILFWQACLALDQARFRAADSLLVLASAYTGSEEAQRALDYRFFLLLDTAAQARGPFFHGLPEAPRGAAERRRSLDQVPDKSPLRPFAQLEKAQILLQESAPDSALAVFDKVAKQSPVRLAGYEAEARAAFLEEKLPGGRQAALARYEDLLIKYQRGVIPEFSRGRIRALR